MLPRQSLHPPKFDRAEMLLATRQALSQYRNVYFLLFQLPIYATPEGSITLVETTHPISPYIAQARESTQSTLSSAATYVEGGVSKWVGVERKVERKLQDPLSRNAAENNQAR